MIWRAIKNYSKYEVSEDGSVRNIKSKKILKPWPGKRGYYTYGLRRDDQVKAQPVAAHTLVAIAFLNFEPQGHKLVIDHIDGNKHNNHFTNLEIISNRENCIRAIENGLHDCRKELLQYDSSGKLVASYISVVEAACKTGFDEKGLASAANVNCKTKTLHGFVWSYVALTPDEVRQKFIKHSTGKQVICIETGVIYPSAREAEKQTGINNGKIRMVCKGLRNRAGGYHWKEI